VTTQEAPSTGAAPALQVSGLSRRYGELEALQGLQLEVAQGECVALIGHNGSGKTTAVRLIGGLLDPTAGVVEVCGVPIHGAGAEAVQARSSLALVPDSPMLYGDLTVGEHLELVAIAHGIAGDDLDERIDALLGRLGLETRRDSRPGELSRGMRQKLMLACALIRPHRVLVLDEPVVGLDPATQRTLRELLLEAKRDGVAVLLTTHQLAFARGIADRAVLLADGAVVEEGPYDAVIDGETVYERGLR
jgi:ABC-2 type transport system ATP-binding protein